MARTTSRHTARRSVFLSAPLLIAAVLVSAGSTTAPAKSRDDALSKHDHQLLAEAAAEGVARVSVLFAVAPEQIDAVAADLESLGSVIRTRDAEIGYLRAMVPLERVATAAKTAGVQAVDVDETIALEDPTPAGSQPPTPQVPPGVATPRVNPYMPTGDTGAAQFAQANPEWDGRDITIGVLDTGIDLVHPALQSTTTGEPKIVDWVTFTHPTDDEDPTWVPMTTEVKGPSFTFESLTYTAPSDHKFRIGLFDERDFRLGGELATDVNRDGNPPGSSGLFGVLWERGPGRVWVDTDQDLDFTDQAGMRAYGKDHDIGLFGTDNPATPVKEEVPFVVQPEAKHDAVNIGIVSGAHGTHVAGILAANGLFGGDMAGAAPGAQLVSVRVCLFITGCTSHALIEGMIWVVEKAKVDVVNMSIGGLPALNDGNNVRAVIYNRLIDKHDVQMFISAGNSGPGTNTVGDPSVATDVMSVGASVTDDTWESNYGSSSPFTDNLFPFSSRGPAEDGSFKPNIVAPGSAISSTPEWQPGGPVVGTYALPPGYSMFNGTSMASPQAAGAAALLLSAAHDEHVKADPERLRLALGSTARFLSGYGAFEQGTGLIDVAAAWDLLQQDPKPVSIDPSVPVDTSLDQFLATPGIGTGIHDREGVDVGAAYTRTYTFTRTSGPGGPVTYDVSWTGNDGTFSAPAQVVLGKKQPTSLDVAINPTAPGAHSAILNLDDPSTPGIDERTMNLVVAPYDLVAAGDWKANLTGDIGRNQADHYFFDVAAETPAYVTTFTGPSTTPGTGQARFLRYNPFGLPIDSNASTSCYSPPAAPSCGGGSPNLRTALNPMPGAWETTIEARRTSDAMFTHWDLQAQLLGATVSPDPDVIASATMGVPEARSYTLTNTRGGFTGRASGSTLGSARRGRFSIGHLELQEYVVNVTPGSTSLRATIGNPSDPGADLDLFVFNCTSGSCALAGLNADGDSEESVTIASPAAGEWRVLVEGFDVPAGTTEYDYIDVFVNAAFGDVSVTDADAFRPGGSAWTVPGSVTANAAPDPGRVLLGRVEVRTDANLLIGSGDVVVESVA